VFFNTSCDVSCQILNSAGSRLQAAQFVSFPGSAWECTAVEALPRLQAKFWVSSKTATGALESRLQAACQSGILCFRNAAENEAGGLNAPVGSGNAVETMTGTSFASLRLCVTLHSRSRQFRCRIQSMHHGLFSKGATRMRSNRKYTVSDGKLVLTLETADEGGYVVTSPLDPELVTEAESIDEAFKNARDALKMLRQSRAKLRRKLPSAAHA